MEVSKEELAQLLENARKPPRPAELSDSELGVIHEFARMVDSKEEFESFKEMFRDFRFKRQRRELFKQNWPQISVFIGLAATAISWLAGLVIAHFSAGGGSK